MVGLAFGVALACALPLANGRAANVSVAGARNVSGVHPLSLSTSRPSRSLEDAIDRPSADRPSADRFVAFDEYRVRENRGPAFEQAFTSRTSQLGLTPGFLFFALMRRVRPPNGSEKDENGLPIGAPDDVTYVSVTMWKSRFDTFDTDPQTPTRRPRPADPDPQT